MNLQSGFIQLGLMVLAAEKLTAWELKYLIEYMENDTDQDKALKFIEINQKNSHYKNVSIIDRIRSRMRGHRPASKPIARTLYELMRERNKTTLYYEDHGLMAEAAEQCGKANLLKFDPTEMVTRIFNNIQKSRYFKKHIQKISGNNGIQKRRYFTIVEESYAKKSA